ncbi:MAG: hypothetical protein ACNI3C_10620 [Candidatus Marinarcus sp.]|uniref:hypothetical protein n=1 Tax=Candidatus Marinarcus sp. TaxID=3100987 RepID=UPI003AFF9D43
MNNSETIAKLNEALSTLIKAYEKLQEENNVLNNQVEKLTLEKNSLIKEKENLEEDISNFENSNQQQNTNINSMLGKIESLLGHTSKTSVYDKIETKQSEIFENKVNPVNNNTISNIEVMKEDKSTNSDFEKTGDDGKLDLNRMASLLNGFGNK